MGGRETEKEKAGTAQGREILAKLTGSFLLV